MERACARPPWPTCLAVRENLLPSGVPHIPVSIEDLPGFVSLSDYRENFIKSVQTIGEILPGEGRVVQLQSISSDREAGVILDLGRLSVDAVYFKDGRGRFIPIWVKRLIVWRIYFCMFISFFSCLSPRLWIHLRSYFLTKIYLDIKITLDP